MKSCLPKLSNITIVKCKREIEQAFLSTLPLCKWDLNIWNKAKRNVLTDGAASCYPFTSFELCDEDGILLGENTMNNSLALMNIFDTRKYSSASIFIAGMTGAGKTHSFQVCFKGAIIDAGGLIWHIRYGKP